MTGIPRAIAVAALAVALAAPPAAGQVSIAPDRPGVSNGTATVARGALQLETGVEYARTSVGGAEPERRLALGAALRAGLGEALEVRLEGEPLVRLRGDDDATDHGDVTLGLKYRVVDAREGRWGPSLGVLPFVKLPIADRPIGSERPDFGAVGLATADLPWGLGLDVNAGLVLVGQGRPSGYLLQGLVSAAVSREIAERLSAFAEIFFASRSERGGRASVGMDAGLTYLLTRTLAIDAVVETSLVGRGPDYAVGAGLSVRFGR